MIFSSKQQSAEVRSKQAWEIHVLVSTWDPASRIRREIMSQFQVLNGLCREEKKIEIWKVYKLWSKRKNPHVYVEQNIELTILGGYAAPKIISETDAVWLLEI